MERRVFQTNCKNSANKPATAGEMLADDANNQYFVGCNSSRELCLDILTKIKNQQLVLEDYKMADGQSYGFLQACRIDSDLVNKVIINSCGLSPDAFATFLRGLSAQKRIFTLSIKRQVINDAAAAELVKILEKKSILKLIIESCEISQNNLTNVLLQLEQVCYRIHNLVFIGLKFNLE